MLSSIEINLVSVLRYEKEQLEFCTYNKNDLEYIIITRWLNNRIRGLEEEVNEREACTSTTKYLEGWTHDWNDIC